LAVDFTPVKSFPIPVFMLMGRHDYTTPSAPTADWLKQVKAPLKKGIWFENSAHLIPLEEPGKLLLTLVNEVRPLALESPRKKQP
jgi:pimeloyl-ACP methyl ester carboxylesterase